MMNVCAIPDCPGKVRAWELMCRVHWFQIPFVIRKRLGEYRHDVLAQRAAVEAVLALTTVKILYSCVLPERQT